MKNILKRLRAFYKFARRPDPLELIVEAFARDPFRRAEKDSDDGSRIDKSDKSK
jgi:hypothetical protein